MNLHNRLRNTTEYSFPTFVQYLQNVKVAEIFPQCGNAQCGANIAIIIQYVASRYWFNIVSLLKTAIKLRFKKVCF